MSLLLSPTTQDIGPVSTLNIIKAIEALGGSRGYLEHIKAANATAQIARPLSLLSVSNSLSSDAECPRQHHNCSITLRAGHLPGLLIGEIKVYNPDEKIGIHLKHVARIRAWLTEGSGCTDLHGTMVTLTSWEDIRKEATKFVIVASDKKGLHATFRRDFLTLAEISADFPEACGVQDGSYMAEGKCIWEDIYW